jgi:PAS domain S-box-containing protein
MADDSEKFPDDERKQAIRDEAEEGIITVDANRCIVIINEVARDMLGVAESSVIGRKVMDVVPVLKPSVRTRINATLRRVLSPGSSGAAIRHVRLVPESGAVCLTSLALMPITNDTGDVVGVVLTFHREAPEKNRSPDVSGREGSDTLTSLVGRIAHDINNSLSSILANIQLARLATDKQSDAYQRLDNAEKRVLRTRDLSGQLLALSGSPVTGVAARKKHPAARPREEKLPSRVAAGKGKAAPDKILLMDDDEAILSATSEMLKFLGYDVAVAENGDAAVEMYEKNQDAGQPFSAVILDVTVPGGRGALETLPRLRKINPDVRVIVSSGYSTNPIIIDFSSYGFTAVIVKPYGFKELGEALNTAFRS